MSEKTIEQKLSALRVEIAKQGVDGFIIPRTDEWQNEYVPAARDRLKMMTGFTGSAGLALVTKNAALIASDTRYEIQLGEQVSETDYPGQRIISQKKGYAPNVAEWIVEEASDCKVIGYDPKLHTPSELKAMRKELDAQGVQLKALATNLVDLIWDDQPELPLDKVEAYPETFAGKSTEDKCAEVALKIREAGYDALLVTQTDAVGWLLNIRGSDVGQTPIALCYAVLHADGSVDLVINPDKLTDHVLDSLGPKAEVFDATDIKAALSRTLTGIGTVGSKVKIAADFNTTPEFFQAFYEDQGCTVEHLDSPVVAARAVKNEAEINALTQAHIVDGVALTKMLRWIDETLPSSDQDELTVEAQLQAFRAESPAYRDDSFSTIAGWKDHGAVVHYRATESSAHKIEGSGLLLLDSGAQYWGDDFAGTTDITRTVAIGTPTDEMKEMFTRVLKGHIAVATSEFTDGATGADLDDLPRAALKEIGENYGHGTGHGVGVYLSVHESGTGIHPLASTAFQPGMFLSNEPGFYKKDEYGIRIENLVLVESADEDGLMMRFNTVSLAPIDARLIKPEFLTDQELSWLNTYHKTVYDVLSVQDGLEAEDRAWLQKATAPILKP